METENTSERSEWRLKTHSSAEKTVENWWRGSFDVVPLFFLEGKIDGRTKEFQDKSEGRSIRSSKIYKDLFVDYDYLLCSKVFVDSDYYIIQGHEDNYVEKLI